MDGASEVLDRHSGNIGNIWKKWEIIIPARWIDLEIKCILIWWNVCHSEQGYVMKMIIKCYTMQFIFSPMQCNAI